VSLADCGADPRLLQDLLHLMLPAVVVVVVAAAAAVFDGRG